MLDLGLSAIAFTELKCVPSLSYLFGNEHHERILIFVKCVYIYVEMILWLLSLIVLIFYTMFIGLHISSHLSIGMNFP